MCLRRHILRSYIFVAEVTILVKYIIVRTERNEEFIVNLTTVLRLSLYLVYLHLPKSTIWRCSVKKVFLNLPQNSQLCQILFFNKIAVLPPATLLKKSLWHSCFPVNFEKFLGAPFFIEHHWWLLLI